MRRAARRAGAAAALAALAALAAPAGAEDMIDLPVNARTLAMGYVYCLTGDAGGAAHVLRQRMIHVGAPRSGARAWLGAGYCDDYLAAADRALPGLRAGAERQLREAGFDPAEPLSGQEEDGRTQASIFRKIGRFLAGLFSGGGGTTECFGTLTLPDGTVLCDRSWSVGGGKFDSAMEPTPFYP